MAELVFGGIGGAVATEQPGLFGVSPLERKRALGGLNRIQAEFGEQSLFRIESRERQLPAARYRLIPVAAAGALPRRASASGKRRRTELPRGEPKKPILDDRTGRIPEKTAIVRRIYDKPLVLSDRDAPSSDSWLLRGMKRGAVTAAAGPYRISGGWWRRLSGRPVERDYYFASRKTGEISWIFHDRERRRWFVEGRVE